jgi:hypothetical protein
VAEECGESSAAAVLHALAGNDNASGAAADEYSLPIDIGKEYRTKRVSVFGRDVTVVLQNENGPCPLLAIGARARAAERVRVTWALARAYGPRVLAWTMPRLRVLAG